MKLNIWTLSHGNLDPQDSQVENRCPKGHPILPDLRGHLHQHIAPHAHILRTLKGNEKSDWETPDPSVVLRQTVHPVPSAVRMGGQNCYARCRKEALLHTFAHLLVSPTHPLITLIPAHRFLYVGVLPGPQKQTFFQGEIRPTSIISSFIQQTHPRGSDFRHCAGHWACGCHQNVAST